MSGPAENPVAAIRAAHAAWAGAGPAWLQAARTEALRTFTAAGFPTQREERWKYTSLAPVAARAAAYIGEPPAPAASGAAAAIAREVPSPAGALRLLAVNGMIQGDLPASLPAGLTIQRLADADETRRAHFLAGLDAAGANDGLAALNAAFLADAVLIETAAGADIDMPVHLLWITDGAPVAAQPRLSVVLGPGSRLHLIEQFAGRGASITNAIADIRCDAGARLDYRKIQEETAEAQHLARQRVTLARDSRLHAVHLELGGALARNDLEVSLDGPGADARVYGLFVADGRGHVDNHLRIDHRAPHSTSQESFRGVVGGRGRGVFNGKIVVHRGADGTDARLSNRNLLLSGTAEVDTKPELEIYADDVKCSHGATTGQLDAASVFYLRSRGVAHDEARRILVRAFANEIVEQIGAADLHQRLEAQLAGRLAAEPSP